MLYRLQCVDAVAKSLAGGDHEQRSLRRRMACDTEPSAVDTHARERSGVRVKVQRQTTARLGLQSARGGGGPAYGPDQFYLERRGASLYQERGPKATGTGSN